MKIIVYQIVPDLDNDHLMFRGLSFIKTANDNKVPADIYESVYSGLRKSRYRSCSDENFKAIETWCMEHHIEYKYL